jgi:3-oxoacyl-(acyl-carrier-protein) synthase
MPDVTSERYTVAIRRALAAAAVDPADVDLITPHGVGAPMLDHFEAESLASVFGTGRAWPPLLAAKAAVGHTLGACALVETIASILAVREGRVPESARCAEPDPALPLGRQGSCELAGEAVLLKCTNGFAGQNGAFVLRVAARA